MARINHVKAAQARFATKPVMDENGEPKVTQVLRRNGEPKLTKRGKPVVMRVTERDLDNPLPMPKCGKCGKTIEVGQPYKWVKTKNGPYGGAKRYRCNECPTWRQSELSSSKMAGIYAAQEHADDVIGDHVSVDDLTALAADLAEQIRGVAEEYRESGTNMEDGFGHSTTMSEELTEKADELDSWADEVENTSFDEYDEEACPVCDGGDDSDTCEDCEGSGLADPDAEERHWETEQEKLLDAIQECPV